MPETEPVDTDAMRRIGNYADWIVRQPGEGPLIRAAADEIDRLRARLSEQDSALPCTCGYGGMHEPDNPRCERNGGTWEPAPIDLMDGFSDRPDDGEDES